MQAVEVPEGLAELPPGPALAAALAGVDLAGVPNDRILAVLRAQYRQLCHDQARMAAVIAEVGRCAGYPEPGQVARLAEPAPYAAAETRAALRWTRRAATASTTWPRRSCMTCRWCSTPGWPATPTGPGYGSSSTI